MATVLKGGTLIDGTGANPVKDAVVVIDDQRIAAAGPAGQVNVPADAKVVDVTGKTVLPGLINTHTHMCWDNVHDLKEQSFNDTSEMVAFKYAMNMRLCLKGGITMIRDMGVPYGVAAVAREAVQLGVAAGPRIIHCGRPLSITGGHAFWMGTREVDGPDAVRKGVREELKGGASWIKIMASGSREEGVGRKGTVWITSLPEFTADELAAAADEAHAAAKKITAHATEQRSIRNCVDAGFDAIEHGGPFDDETLQLMADKGIWLVPTLSPAYLQVERGASIGMPAFEIERRKKQLLGKRDPVVRAKSFGVKFALGTDAGSPAVSNDEVVREMELMHEFGICESPMDAIVVGTRNGAQLLGVDEALGTLQAGKQADILVVDGDPLADLANLRKVSLVYLAGDLMVRDGVVLQ